MSESTTSGAPAPTGAIGIGGVFSRTFSALGANLVTFLVISFLILLPLFLFNLAVGGGMAANPLVAGPSYYIGLAISIVLTYTAVGAMVYGTVTYLSGQKAGLGDCLSRGLSAFLPVILMMTAAAVPAAVVERPGIWSRVKRGAELTKGNRWRVFALLVIFYVVLLGIGWALQVAGLPVLAPDGTMASIVMIYVWGGISTTFFAVFGAVIYHDLRVAKEGAGAAQFATVFE